MAYQISLQRLVAWGGTDQLAPAPIRVCPISGESPREETINCLTHGLGLFLSITGLVFLVALANVNGNLWHIIGCTVYSLTLVMAYAASTLYHGSTSLSHKRVLRQIDQAFVYLLIAGTYTPFTLVPLHGGWGWSLLITVWGITAAAIGVKFLFTRRVRDVSVPVALSMGWLCVVAFVPLTNSIPWNGILWLLAGGISYTLGTVFLVRKPLPFSHGIWHIAVLLGSVCHYFAVVFYVIPLG